MKRISYLEAKTDDLENWGRRKNLRLFGLREGTEGQQPTGVHSGGAAALAGDRQILCH